MKKLVVLTGPTAVGKTNLSIELAKRINGEIISADSIQVYKGMDVGSAKITEDEMQGVKHYLIDVLEPTEEFNVFTFKQMALEAMDEIYAKGKIPIIVGGTGFYIQSIVYDIDFEDRVVDEEYRKKLYDILENQGEEYLHNMLREVDEESAEKIHANNVKRVIRALEFHHDNNIKLSDHNDEQRAKSSPYNFAYYVLFDDRDKLYVQIGKRVDDMLKNGLVEEVQGLLDAGIDPNSIAMQGIGYKEVVVYLMGKYTEDEMSRKIKTNTRHFAKKQLTWFKREKTVDMIDLVQYDYNKERILEHIEKDLYSKGITCKN